MSDISLRASLLALITILVMVNAGCYISMFSPNIVVSTSTSVLVGILFGMAYPKVVIAYIRFANYLDNRNSDSNNKGS